MAKQLDTVGWFIVTLHQLIGHDQAARFIGVPPGVKELCILCAFERCDASREDVLEAIGRPRDDN